MHAPCTSSPAATSTRCVLLLACLPACLLGRQVLGCVVELFGEVSSSDEVRALQSGALEACTARLDALAAQQGAAVQVGSC